MSVRGDERLEEVRAFLAKHDLAPVRRLEPVAQSLVHRSYAYEHDEIPDNERLEFLGDAVLGCLAAELLHREFPADREGDLSKKRAFLVSRTQLGLRAEELGLAAMVRLGRGEESSGGRRRLSVTGSALEALVGALYLEMPFPTLRRFVWDKVLKPGLSGLSADAHKDYKSRLQELLQGRGQTVPEYRKVDEEGPAHSKRFSIEVYAAGRLLGRGEGSRVKIAENRAARQAYLALREEGS